jgi:hypothetical protein
MREMLDRVDDYERRHREVLDLDAGPSGRQQGRRPRWIPRLSSAMCAGRPILGSSSMMARWTLGVKINEKSMLDGRFAVAPDDG